MGAMRRTFIFIAQLAVLSAAIPWSDAIAQNFSETINMFGQDLSTKPTFNCAKAKSATARIICLDQAGAKADWDLTAVYWARIFSFDETARGDFDKAHDDWFQSLNRGCRLQADQINFPSVKRQCVLTAYRERANSYRSQLNGDALYESKLSPEQHAKIQSELIGLGFLNDVADGEFGPHTRAAINRFQAQSGFTQSEFLTAQQRQQLVQALIPTKTERSVSDPAMPPFPPISTLSISPPNKVIELTADNQMSPPIVAQNPPASPPHAAAAQVAAEPKLVDDNQWLERFLTANGGCAQYHSIFAPWHMQDVQSRSTAELFGKPVLKWSDNDVGTALRLFQDCEAKGHAKWLSGCMGYGHYTQSECEQPIMAPPNLYPSREFEKWLRNTVAMARNQDIQQKAQQQAKIDVEKAQAENKRVQAEEAAQQKEQGLREQAQRDKGAAEEAAKTAAREEPRIAEATKEAADARRQRDEAEQRLAKIRSQTQAQMKEGQQALARRQQAEKEAAAEAVAQATQEKLKEQRARAEQEQRRREETLAASDYQNISVEQFVLDGKDLAVAAAKVALGGVYLREGNLDVLYANVRSVMLARGGPNQPKVMLLTDDASRQFRQHLLTCQSNPAGAQMGCSVAFLGHATTCKLSNAFGGTRESPCVAVEGEQQ